MRKVVDDGCALLVPPDDPERWAAAVRRGAYDSDLRQRLGDNARERLAALPRLDDVADITASLLREGGPVRGAASGGWSRT